MSAKPVTRVQSALTARRGAAAWIVLGFVILAAGLIRVHLLNIPFERDTIAGQILVSDRGSRYLWDAASEQHPLTDATQALVMRRRDDVSRP